MKVRVWYVYFFVSYHVNIASSQIYLFLGSTFLCLLCQLLNIEVVNLQGLFLQIILRVTQDGGLMS